MTTISVNVDVDADIDYLIEELSDEDLIKEVHSSGGINHLVKYETNMNKEDWEYILDQIRLLKEDWYNARIIEKILDNLNRS